MNVEQENYLYRLLDQSRTAALDLFMISHPIRYSPPELAEELRRMGIIIRNGTSASGAVELPQTEEQVANEIAREEFVTFLNAEFEKALGRVKASEVREGQSILNDFIKAISSYGTV